MQKTNESTFYKSLFGDIFYKDSGPKDAPAVIFLHGVGMDHRTFDEQVNVLKDRYRVIVFDLPGHGRSTIKNYNFSFTPRNRPEISMLSVSIHLNCEHFVAKIYSNRTIALKCMQIFLNL